MRNRTILGMPVSFSAAVAAVCLLGIAAGSFLDFDISEALANRTALGEFVAAHAVFFPCCVNAAGSGCLFAGLRKKGGACRLPAWGLLALGMFLAVNDANRAFGGSIRGLLGYTAGESAVWPVFLSYLIQTAFLAWIPALLVRFLDDSDPDRLIAVGAAILAAGIAASGVNGWLKEFASRPRYKYLLKQEDPRAAYRAWWQMVPYLGGGDSLKSWPSGHMTQVTSVFTLPLITGCLKKPGRLKSGIAADIACAAALAVGYNRIHMTNHFLSDVCFGFLITYAIYAAVSAACLKAAEKRPG